MRSQRRSSSGWWIGIVGALLVVDVVIVSIAVQAQTPDGAALAGASATPTTSDPAGPEPVQLDPAQMRTLVMTSSADGWRAHRGACPAGGATLEATTDGGATWTAAALPAGATEIQQMVGDATTPDRLSVVALDGSCERTFDRTFSGGAAWQAGPDLAATATYVGSRGEVVASGVRVPSPCAEPLAMLQASVTVLQCASGVYTSSSAGAWAPVEVDGLLAVATAGEGVVVVRTPSSEGEQCAGLVVEQRTADLQAVVAAQCVETGAVASPAVAASVVGVEVWLWVDGVVLRAQLAA